MLPLVAACANMTPGMRLDVDKTPSAAADARAAPEIRMITPDLLKAERQERDRHTNENVAALFGEPHPYVTRLRTFAKWRIACRFDAGVRAGGWAFRGSLPEWNKWLGPLRTCFRFDNPLRRGVFSAFRFAWRYWWVPARGTEPTTPRSVLT